MPHLRRRTPSPLAGLALGSLVAVAALPALPARGATLRVPADQPSIQAAVDASAPGDLILVASGLYNEAVLVEGRSDLRIEGENGPTSTSMLAPGYGPAFEIRDCDNIVVSGFTISSESFTGDSLEAGVRLTRVTNAGVHHCIFTRQAGNAVTVLGATFEVWNVLTYDIGDDAVSLRSQSDMVSAGIVHSCTFVDSTTGSAIGVWASDSVDRVAVFNSIIHGNNYGLADGTGRAIIDHDYNLVGNNSVNDYYGPLVRESHEPNCDPMFIDRPGADYHLDSASCAVDVGTDVFLGIPAADDDIEGQSRPGGSGYELGVDEIGCTVVGIGATLLRSCSGDDVALDASGLALPDCVGSVAGVWADAPGEPALRIVSPTMSTDYDYVVSCSTDPNCTGMVTFSVLVEHAPTAPVSLATDIAPCNTAILLEWEASTFETPAGAVYNLYRSEIDCDEALAHPLAIGLSDLRWLDDTTVHGGRYWYVVEAEDGLPDGACAPQGADHLGSAARTCLGPVDEVADAPLPEPVFAVLRASHQGQELRLHWAASRALEPNEHFHLLKASGSPEVTFSLVSAEPWLGLEHVETDAGSPLQFFDLRAANECEQQSEDEFPRSR